MNKIETEVELVKKNPYKYVGDWMEGVLLHVGKKVFEFASLLPSSHILPDIPFGASTIRAQMNLLVLAGPGSGKSSLCKKFSRLVLNPITFRKITAPELVTQMAALEMFTIINEDFTQIAEDYDVIKNLEGALGDEKRISDKTMRRKIDIQTQGIGLFCGTPSDLMRYMRNLEGGFFSRLVPILISHTPEQHAEIGKYINTGIGNSNHAEEMTVKEEACIEYYKILRLIQEGKHKDIPPIARYDIQSEIKDKIYTLWETLTRELVTEMDAVWIRELHEAYRTLFAHAFLNIFNRKVETYKLKDKDNVEKTFGILKPTTEDYHIAVRLMKSNITFKYFLIKATALNSRIRSADALRSILNSSKVPEQAKNILINISPFSVQLGFTKNGKGIV